MFKFQFVKRLRPVIKSVVVCEILEEIDALYWWIRFVVMDWCRGAILDLL